MAYDRLAFLKTTLAASAALASDAQVQGQASSLFPGFTTQKIHTSGATIHALRGGSGPPPLLLHGYPQTHVAWHEIAPRLAEQFTVVMTTRTPPMPPVTAENAAFPVAFRRPTQIMLARFVKISAQFDF